MGVRLSHSLQHATSGKPAACKRHFRTKPYEVHWVAKSSEVDWYQEEQNVVKNYEIARRTNFHLLTTQFADELSTTQAKLKYSSEKSPKVIVSAQ